MKEYLTPNRIANKLRMIRTNPTYQFCSFLIVEGDTDGKFFQKLINREKCQVTISHNKANAKTILQILEEESFLGILAIVDADFEALEGRLPASPNILFTDTHDLETMILQSPALEKFLWSLHLMKNVQQLRQNLKKSYALSCLNAANTLVIYVGYPCEKTYH